MAVPAGPPVVLAIGILVAGEPGAWLPPRLVDRGSDARTLAKEASGPAEGGMGYESPVVDWIADAESGYDTAKYLKGDLH